MNKHQTVCQSKEQIEFVKNHKSHHKLVGYARIFVLILFLCIWELTAKLNLIDEFFFSSPSSLFHMFVEFSQSMEFWSHLWITFYETLLSFTIVTLLSLFVGYILWREKRIAEVLEPYLVILNSLPKSALAPLFIVWLGTGIKTIIVAGISVAIFGSIVSFYYAFNACDPEKIVLIQTLGGSRNQCFFKVVFPCAVPSLFTTSKVNIGLSLVGVIIGEFLAARRGLGYLIIYGSQVFLLSQVIFCIIVLCIMAFCLYRLIQYLEHKIKALTGL